MKFKPNSLITELSNEDYHAQQPEKDHFFSSSQLKTMLESPELFYKMYIEQSIEKESKAAYDVGTYYHTAVLEPELLDKECAVYTGAKRIGKKWEEFQDLHKDKTIITKADLIKAERLIDATLESDIAMDLVDDVDATVEESLFMNFMGLRCKVRFDIANWKKGLLGDLKSTTGNPGDYHTIRTKISNINYDMSAAFYLDMANEYIRLNDLDCPEMEKFYWIFATKDRKAVKTWLASEKMIKVGRAKYTKAIEQILKYKKAGWKFTEEVGIIDPVSWDASDWLSDIDLL